MLLLPLARSRPSEAFAPSPLAVVASPGAPERKPRRDVESRGGDHRDGDDDDDENRDAERDRPGLRRALRAGMLGVQWGIGHALGLALVCAVFFATRRRMNLDDFGNYADKAVGASMIALGLISLWHLRTWRTRRERERAHIVDERVAGAGDPEVHAEVPARCPSSQQPASSQQSAAPSRQSSPRSVALVLQAGSEEHAAAHDMRLPHIHVPRGSSPSSPSSSPAKPASSQRAAAERVTSPGGAARFGEQKIDDESKAEVESSTDDKSRRGWSMSIGLVHGVAGPSGILAVLPAVVLADAGKSAAYLVAFFVASATAMGAFAAIFGYVTDLAVRRQMDDGRDGRCEEDVGEREGVGFDSRERRVGTRATDAATRVAMGLNLGAGVLAVAVGTLWLILSGLGLLGSL